MKLVKLIFSGIKWVFVFPFPFEETDPRTSIVIDAWTLGFESGVMAARSELFERLAKGKTPDELLIELMGILTDIQQTYVDG